MSENTNEHTLADLAPDEVVAAPDVPIIMVSPSAELPASAGTDGITLRLREVVKLLEPVDLETAIKNIEEEPLPGGPEERRAAAVNRADRAELLRAFLALRETGRAIVRRLEDDTAGRARDE